MTAQEKILAKSLVTSGLSSTEIDRVLAGLKDRAFFSARCESVRHLQTAQQQVADWLGSAKRGDGAITTRASAISAVMASARKEGLSTGTGTLTDPASVARAKVIVDTNADLARGYVSHVQGASTGARLAFPAQELIRTEDRKNPRGDWHARWSAAGGKLYAGRRMIALKEDPIWTAISRFGVPYPPFDYGSGMGVADVDRDTCLSLGVIKEDYRPEGDLIEDFNATLEAQVEFKGTNDPNWQFLQDSFGAQIKYQDGKIRWQANIITDALSNPASVRLGSSLAQPGLNLSIPKDTLSHIWAKHGPDDSDPRNVPMCPADMALLPHVWRTPDHKTQATADTWHYDKASSDGSTYRLVLKIADQEVQPVTFYKLRGA